MRVRIALCVLTLLALASFHLQPSLADPVPPPEAPHSAPVARSGPSRADSDRALIAALTLARAQQEADDAAVAEQAAKAHPARTVRVAAVSAPVAAPAYDSGSMEELVCSIFVDSCGRAIRVFTCESGLNPAARNRSGASGIAQIMLPMHADLFTAHGWDWHTDWSDPYKNLIVAYDLSGGGTSWDGWVCR